jgi:hypothetical protein
MLENASAIEYREHRLQELCPLRPSVPVRSPPPSKSRPIGDPAGLSFYAAKRRVGPKRAEALLELARHASQRIGEPMLRELFAAVGIPGVAAAHLEDAERFVDRLLLLPADEQLETIGLFRETARVDTLRTELIAALSSAGLLELSPPLRRQLLRYLIGPRPGEHAHPDHELDLRAFWARRAAETVRFLDAATTDRDAAAKSYLVRPIRPVHVLRTPADLDLLIVVFGDPRSSRSLSFGRYYTFDERGRAEPSVVCPDPRIAREWRDRDPLTSHTYECRSALLTRAEELEVLRWLEQTCAIAPFARHRPRSSPFSIFTNARRLAETIEPTIRLFASVRGPLAFTRTLLFRGRPQRSRRSEGWIPSAK